MSLTIELPYDLESQLREQAKRKGKALNQYITGLIQERVNLPKPESASLSADETLLFQIINKGFSDEFWLKFHSLDKKRQQIKLTETERAELIAMSEEMENVHLDRLKALIELAAIRQTDIDTLMAELGLDYGKNT
jgi:hypothetical protein